MKLLSSKVVLFVFVVLSVLVIPFLYQNCEMASLKELHQKSADSGSVTTTNLQYVNFDINLYNGIGTRINEVMPDDGIARLCAGQTPTEEEAKTLYIALLTAENPTGRNPDNYLCRQVLPTANDEFWNCDELLVDGKSGGGFSWASGAESEVGPLYAHRSLMRLNGLSEGTYELEIVAKGGAGNLRDFRKEDGYSYLTPEEIEELEEIEREPGPTWQTQVKTVKFIVEDCSSIPESGKTCVDIYHSSYAGKAENYCACPPFEYEATHACGCYRNLVRNADGQCVCPGGESPTPDGYCLSTNMTPVSYEGVLGEVCHSTCADFNADCTTGDWYDCGQLHDGRSNNFANGHLSSLPQNCCLPEDDTATPEDEGEECSPICSDYNGDCTRGDWYDCGRLHDNIPGITNNFGNGHLSANQQNCCLRPQVKLTCAQANYDCAQHGKVRRGTKQWNDNSPANEENCCRVAPE